MSAAFVSSCECGFSGRYSSQAKADYALRRHSCERWQRRAEAARKAAAREAAVDRTPKPCLHKEADHQHGTHACYALDRCRCRPCSDANAAYESTRIRLKAYGRWNGLVDAEPARAHVLELMAQGMGIKRVVKVSGVPQGVLWKLLYGRHGGTPSRRIKPATEARLLAVRLDLADGAKIANVGTARRLQALVALGWSQSKLARRLEVEATNFGRLIHARQQTTVGTARAVRELYDELSMQLPPETDHRDKIAAARSRNYAKAHGWLPPLAWDDELLDDPDYFPEPGGRERGLAHVEELDEAAIYRRRMHGDRSVRLSKADAAELVRRWAASGRPLAECERITGIKTDRFYRLKDHNTDLKGIAS